jgi:hypothetical protein
VGIPHSSWHSALCTQLMWSWLGLQ